MKCKYCDGTGTSNWCINGIFQPCEYCNGTGEVEVVGDSVTDVCDKCGGTGFFCEMRTGDVCTLGSPCPHQEPLTNEEWFCSLSTKEKAHELYRRCNYASIFGSPTAEEIEKWLKDVHKE